MNRLRDGTRRLLVLTTSLVALLSGTPLAAAVQGAGMGLVPPTATRYADPAWYDIVDVALDEGADVLRVRIELGAIDPSGGLPLGITQPIVEVYLDNAPGGAGDLLPGSGMRMPDGEGWNVAIRVTGDGAWGWLADEDGRIELARPVALEATASGRTVEVTTPFEPAPGARTYAITGVYDPFRADGWRAMASIPSPWAFSSVEPRLPVVDVFPADAAAVARAVTQGVLPRPSSFGTDVTSTVWVTLMLAGLAVGVVGLWWRRRVPPLGPVVVAAPPDGPRYVALEIPTGRTDGAPAPAGIRRHAASTVAGDLLIGEGDFEALLARLEATIGLPVPPGRSDPDATDTGATDTRATDTRATEPEARESAAAHATIVEPVPSASPSPAALRRSGPFEAFVQAARGDEDDEAGDVDVGPSR